MKKPDLWDRGMVTGGPGQKPDWKKWPSLSHSDMVTGGISFTTLIYTLHVRFYAQFDVYFQKIKNQTDIKAQNFIMSIFQHQHTIYDTLTQFCIWNVFVIFCLKLSNFLTFTILFCKSPILQVPFCNDIWLIWKYFEDLFLIVPNTTVIHYSPKGLKF